MTLNEKSAAPCLVSFTEVVEKACEKLKSKQIKYSIRRIADMEDRLSILEKELDEFLKGWDNNEN